MALTTKQPSPRPLLRRSPLAQRRLSYEEARALYFDSEESLMSPCISIRNFIFSRWLIGQYLREAQKTHLIEDWPEWLSKNWPEISLSTSQLWMNLYKRAPYNFVMQAPIDELKSLFIYLMYKAL